MVPNRFSVVLVAMFLLLVLLPGPAGSQAVPLAGCTNGESGSILVPTFTSGPPSPLTLINVALNDIYVHVAWFQPVGQGRTFYLAPSAGDAVFGTELPDFNIAFYRNGVPSAIAVHNNVGRDTGNVPPNADEAMIWMRTGPDSPTNLDGNHFGAEFNYADSCNGTPSWW